MVPEAAAVANVLATVAVYAVMNAETNKYFAKGQRETGVAYRDGSVGRATTTGIMNVTHASCPPDTSFFRRARFAGRSLSKIEVEKEDTATDNDV